MKPSFQAVCEAAAERWSVPALVVGTGDELVAVGCDPGTRFRIASITKPLTALLALRLLDPDSTTGIWPDDVRLRHLLSHTSGYDAELENDDDARYGTDDGALARRAAELPHVRRLVGADIVWSYANTGYWLAGHLAAERAGVAFEEALAEHVLRPARLEATDFGEPDVAGTGSAATAGPYPRSRRPSGGLVSNVPDLLRLARWFVPESAPLRVVHGKPIGGVYGLGLFGERVGGVDVWGHTGSWGGFQSSFRSIPSHDAVFVGLTNSSLGSKALAEIEDVFFEQVVGARRASPRFLKPEPGELARFAGVYENGNGRYEVEDAGDGLLVRNGGDELIGLKIRERTFCVPVGDHVNERFDFPREGFGRFGPRLAVRV